MSKTKERIRESNLRYRQSLGQNFLYDEDLLATLVADAGVGPEEDVLEIGPGAGSLTAPLCDAAHHVLSLELDERLIPLLEAFMAGRENFSLLQGDVMTANLAEITGNLRRPFAVVANIPYYITTPLITRLLTCGLPLSRLALMVQKEVAEKILSHPGEEGWGPLAVRCQYQCDPYLARIVPAACSAPEGGQRLPGNAPAAGAGGPGSGGEGLLPDRDGGLRPAAKDDDQRAVRFPAPEQGGGPGPDGPGGTG